MLRLRALAPVPEPPRIGGGRTRALVHFAQSAASPTTGRFAPATPMNPESVVGGVFPNALGGYAAASSIASV